MASEMTWYDRNVERARLGYEAALKFREDLLERDRRPREGEASQEAEKARREKALALFLKRLSLSIKILHPDPEGEEGTVKTAQAVFDFALDRYGNSAIFQSVRGPPSCGYLIQLPVKLARVTSLFRGLGDCDLEPFEVQGLVRCSGANHRSLAHEGILKFGGFKIEELEAE